MPDWLFDADVWVKIVAVLTAALGLMTALVTFRNTAAPVADPPQVATAHRLRLLSLEGESAKPWLPFWFKCLMVVFGILSLSMTGVALWLFTSKPSVSTAIPFLFFGACTAAYVLVIKRSRRSYQQGSSVKREATINIQGNYDQIWDECIAALKRIKVTIRTADAKKGQIDGSTNAGWKTWGEIVVVQITKISEDEYAVHIKSDSRLVTLMFDYGRNASNIEGFFQELVH
jgi:hypothetical protein